MKHENKKAIELIEDFFLNDEVSENIAWLKATIDAAEYASDVTDGDKTYSHVLFCIRGFAEVIKSVQEIKETPVVEA
jgi:hypothetical protein